MNIREKYNKKQKEIEKYRRLGFPVSNLKEIDKKLYAEYNNMNKMQENLVIKKAIENPELLNKPIALSRQAGVPKEIVEETLRKTNFEEILDEHNLGKESLASDMELFRQKIMSDMEKGEASNRDLINWFALQGKFNGADRQQIDVSLEDKGDIFDIINKNINNGE